MTMTRYMLFCGAGAALASLSSVALLARAEGEPALRPISASGHWLWGDDAAVKGEPGMTRSGVGGATNIGAGLMWGGLFGAWVQRNASTPGEVLRDGAALGAVAGLLDYGLLPRRLSPGWELALSSRSVVLSMAAMAAGAVAGAFAARAVEGERR